MPASSTVIDFLSRAIHPTTLQDLIFSATAFVVAATSFLTGFRFIAHDLKSLATLVMRLVSIGAIYCITLASVVPFFQRFPASKTGILITNFKGNKLEDHFGNQAVSEALCNAIEAEIQKLGSAAHIRLDTIIEVKTVSWAANSEADALRLMRQYRATAVQWGSITRLGVGTAELTGFLNVGPLPLCVNLSPGPIYCHKFEVISGPSFKLQLSDTNYNVSALAGGILEDVLPKMATKYEDSAPSLVEALLCRLPLGDSSFRALDHSAFVVLSAAKAAREAKDTGQALSLFKLSYVLMRELRTRIRNGTTTVNSEDEILPFAMYSRWNQGELLLKRRDTATAFFCFQDAFLIGLDHKPDLAGWCQGMARNLGLKILLIRDSETGDSLYWKAKVVPL